MNLLRCLLPALLLIALPLAPAPASAAPAAQDGEWFYQGSDIPRDPAWTFGTLPNGLRYAVRRNALPAGQVAIRVRIDAGSLQVKHHVLRAEIAMHQNRAADDLVRGADVKPV